jgi:hypothetical protein
VAQASGEQEIKNDEHDKIQSPDMHKNADLDSDDAQEVLPRSSNKKHSPDNIQI